MSDAIAGAAMRCRTMADGTLRVEIDIEPGFAKAAFELFGTPGAPVALAALRVGAAEPEPEPQPERPKGGPLCALAGQWCERPEFWSWVMARFAFLWHQIEDELGEDATAKQITAEVIRRHCNVRSRAELDHDEMAGKQFNAVFRVPFSEWLKSNS